MKSKNIVFLLILLSVNQFTKAQITPIKTIIDTNKTTYNTKLHSYYRSVVKNQSYELKQKAQENVKIKSDIDSSFINACLNENTYSSLKNENMILIVEFITDIDGNVLSSSLINIGNKVSISVTEVECILTKAINQKFNFTNIPSEINEFNFKIRKHFKIE